MPRAKAESHSDYLIAQLSDLHLTRPGVFFNGTCDGWARFSNALASIAELIPKPDCLVISGDIADRPDTGVYERFRAMLDASPIPVFAFPGNHDGRDMFRAVFADAPYVDPASEFINYVIDGNGFRAIILDSLEPETGEARLCPARLAWLEDRLSEDPETATMVFMHHQPLYTRLGFRGAAEAFPGVLDLRAVLDRHDQVVRLACGHMHRPIFSLLGKTPVSVAASSTYQRTLTMDNAMPKAFCNEPPSMLLHLWQPAMGLMTHIHFIGDFGPPDPMLDV